MRSLWPFLLVGLLLMTGLLVGCNQQPERMKNEPTNLEPKNGGFDKTMPGGQTKHFEGAQ
jgi:hypothetical protein